MGRQTVQARHAARLLNRTPGNRQGLRTEGDERRVPAPVPGRPLRTASVPPTERTHGGPGIHGSLVALVPQEIEALVVWGMAQQAHRGLTAPEAALLGRLRLLLADAQESRHVSGN